MALSTTQTSALAMMIKAKNPDISDAELATYIQKANDVSDPAALDTNLKSGYAGSSQEAANPTNPQASAVSQFDPELMKNALAKYQQLNSQQAPSRFMAGLGASMGDATGMAAVKNQLDHADALNLMNSIGGQEKLQATGTAGLVAADKAQSMNKVAGDFQASQMKAQEEINQARQKTQSGALDAATKQRLNTPNTVEAKFAKTLMLAQLQSNPALANNKDLADAVRDPNVTAQMLMGFMDANVLDAYKKQLGIVTEETKAAGDQAVSKDLYGATKPVIGNNTDVSAVNPSVTTFNFKPGTNMKLVREHLANNPAVPEADLAAFDKKYPDAAPTVNATPQLSQEAKDRLKYSAINGAGQTLQPNPIDVAKAKGTGDQAVSFNERVRTYKTVAEPQIDLALSKLDSTMSGKGTDLISRWMPGNEQQELVNLLAQVNNTYPSALPSSVANSINAAQKAGGYTGSMVASMTNDQLRSALKMIKANVARDINYQNKQDKSDSSGNAGNFGKTQEVSSNTAPSGTTVMTKDGATYDIPNDKVDAARAKGFK